MSDNPLGAPRPRLRAAVLTLVAVVALGVLTMAAVQIIEHGIRPAEVREYLAAVRALRGTLD